MLGQMKIARLQEELVEFVRSEHAAQRKKIARVWAMPIDQRVEEGHCITGGSLSFFKPPQGIILAFPANDSRFREGDFVRVSLGNPEEPLFEAVVVRAEDENIELAVRGNQPRARDLEAAQGKLQLDESLLDLEKLYMDAIDELGRTTLGREKILPLLAGELMPKVEISHFEASIEAAAKEGRYNDQQLNALANALSTDLCWLIHGPPGTGKTRVLAWVVQKLLERGERVFVTSANHRAINNLLQAIAEVGGDSRAIFKVSAFQDPSLLLPQVANFSEIPEEVKAGAYVIGATPFALRSQRLKGVDFDTLLMDEASQVSVVLAAMAMLSAQRFLFASDHHQLPPS